ncbi:MAG: hypothetical protein PHP93_03580, partial [Kiritimatiellales bacterium]|nr:hypothetical protein [Kiritimatiellales bacterium]
MQKIMTTFTAVVLCAAAGFAQEKSDSVDGIFKELANYTGAPAVAVEQPTPAPVAAEVYLPVVTQVEQVAPVQVEPAALEPAVVMNGTIDAKALMEESRDQYAAGEFAKAQQGFEKIVKIAPESWMARMYLRTLMERDQRKMEVKGMKAVSAAWSTDLVVRSYALGSEACEKMGLADTKTVKDVSAIFPQVDFPKGSSAIYQPKMEALFVRNTRENLTVLEAILGAMNLAQFSTDTDQVEIESKFIEVSEGTLEELGFEWRSMVGNDIGLGGDVTAPGGQYLFDDALRGGASGPAMPFTQPGSLGYGTTAASGNW